MIDSKIRARELCGTSDGRFKRHCSQQRFSGFRKQAAHDSHDPEAANLKLSFLRRRSKIVEIVSTEDIVFALTLSVCISLGTWCTHLVRAPMVLIRI